MHHSTLYAGLKRYVKNEGLGAVLKRRDMAGFYEQNYSAIYGSGTIGLASKWMHKSLERGLRRDQKFETVLEVGSGKGEHFPYVRHQFTKFIETDIQENLLLRPNVRDVGIREQRKADAQELAGFAANSIDRLISTCLISHLAKPREALERWKQVVRPGGIASIYLPHEPGLALNLAQALFPARKVEAAGLDYWDQHHFEHPYHLPFLRALTRSVFGRGNVHFSGYPFPGLPWQMNLWSIASVKIADEK
jgi:SAM-dependent methyltransferase